AVSSFDLAVSRAIPRPYRDGTPGVAGLLRHLLRHSRAVPAGDGGADPPVGGSAGGAYPPAWRAGLGVPFAGSGGVWRAWPMTLRSSALQPTPRRAQRHRLQPRNPFPVGPKSAASSAAMSPRGSHGVAGSVRLETKPQGVERRHE